MPRKPREEESAGRGGGWLFALGAGAGLAMGMILSGRGEADQPSPAERLTRGARSAAGRIRPGRLRRGSRDHAQLTRLEDEVLDALIRDDVLAGRGIDVGALSPGIIELSGSVRTLLESERALSLVGRVPGVETVVNRLAVESAAAPPAREAAGGEWGGRVSGMGRTRQGRGTGPDRPDDAQHLQEVSLEHSDRRELEEEGISYAQPRMAARPGRPVELPGEFAEDELGNQDPHARRAAAVPEEERERIARDRVGEGLMPGMELRLEQADVPVKPHAGERREDADEPRR